MASKGGLFRCADSVDKLLMFLGILGSLGDSLAAPMTMFVLSGALDAFGSADQSIAKEVVNKYVFKLLYIAVGIGFAAFIEGVCWTRTAERQTSRIRTEYLKSVLRQEVGFFDKQDVSSTTFQVVSNISADAHLIQAVIAEKIPTCLTQLCAFIFSLLVSFLLSWRLALASLPFAIGFIVPGVGFGKLMMNLGIKSKEAYGVAGGIAEQAISSIRTVYSYVGEHQTLKRFSHALQGSTNLGIKQGLVKGLLIGSMGMIFATWAFQSWVGSILVTEKGESGGHVFVSGICVILGGLSLMSALPNVPSITEASAAAKGIFELIDRVPEIDSESDKGKVLANVRGQIEFREVYFSYPSRKDTLVLQGFNLKVKAGKTVALVGGSGSGKSTIVSLLERFYDPIKGDILLDGHRIKRLQLKWLRSQMGLVNQQPILFATSIKENILFGKEDASMELVISAAKAANAHDFINKLPEGYDTQVGESGIQLSGGQKQRIAIARALLKDPRILLLDEATSALDEQSESVVQEAINQASVGRTTIIIAHRLSTIRMVDKILVLQSGRVVESGSHDELMQINNEEGGVYFGMMKVLQSAVQNMAPDSPHHPIEGRHYDKTMYAHTPKSPFSVRSSAKNSPASVFSPALILSGVTSIQNSPASTSGNSDDSNLGKLKNSSSPSLSNIQLLQMNAPEWKRALLGCLGAVVFGAIQPVNSYCMGAMISVYLLDDSSKLKSEARFYCVIFLVIGFISFFANLLQHYNFAIMGERLTKRIREEFLQKVLTFEVEWFDLDENTSAAVCARLSTEANMVRSLVGDRMSLLVQVLTNAALSYVLALIVAWKVAIVMIAIQPFIIASFYSKNALMKIMSENAQEAQNDGSQLASEAVVNHRTITAFSSQKRILDLFEETLKGPRKQSVKLSWFSGVGLFTSQFLTTTSIALTFWYGGTLMSKGLLSSKDLFLAFFILMSTGKTIADAGTMTSDLSKGSSAVRSVFAILDRKSKIEPNHPEGSKIEKKLRGRIELTSVFFSYPSRPEQLIFYDLNLKIEAGKTVALVGQSGSGKSTVLGLIERFYDPIKGSVLIDNHDVKSYNLRDLRSHIALVSQEPTLFAGTIHENIVYGKEDASEAEIREAAMLANAHEFISSMEDGYQTYCGERGVQLSGGQKQRVALARAILKNPSILLLDEATSSLDSLSENIVQEALEKMIVGRTCVIVAHRLSTIQKADCIMVIKNGKVVEEGSHHELLAAGDHGFYYSLIKLQHGHSLASLE
ncbi:ABC transporter B family member 15 [Forsythia ovata]|uniref:ABC transporter B family member 15 n=1 Tax=Forsythia ovata TaxID=205694 RepID=A0ABD1WBR3_9LAMI